MSSYYIFPMARRTVLSYFGVLCLLAKNESIIVEESLFIAGGNETIFKIKKKLFLQITWIEGEKDHSILHRCPIKDRAKQNMTFNG